MFDEIRDRHKANLKSWSLFSHPVCLKVWKRLRGIGTLFFFENAWWHGTLAFRGRNSRLNMGKPRISCRFMNFTSCQRISTSQIVSVEVPDDFQRWNVQFLPERMRLQLISDTYGNHTMTPKINRKGHQWFHFWHQCTSLSLKPYLISGTKLIQELKLKALTKGVWIRMQPYLVKATLILLLLPPSLRTSRRSAGWASLSRWIWSGSLRRVVQRCVSYPQGRWKICGSSTGRLWEVLVANQLALQHFGEKLALKNLAFPRNIL